MTKKRSFLVTLLIMLMCVAIVFAGCNSADKPGENEEKPTTNTTDPTDTTGDNGPDSNDPDDNTPQFDDPNEEVLYAISNTMNAMASSDAVYNVLAEAVKGGKITIEAADMIKNELYLDVFGNQYADILTIKQMDQEIQASAYLKDGKLAVSVPMVFGDEVYGIDFNTLEDDLKNCELWAMMDTTYEEFQTQAGINIDGLEDALEQYLDAVSGMGEDVIDSLKNVKVTREEGTVVINGETVDAVNVKYQMTSKDVLDFMLAMLDESEKSMEAMVDAMSSVLTGVDMDEILDEMDMETSRQELTAAFEDVDLQGDLVISIDPETQYMMCMSLDVAGTADGEQGKIEMDLVLGADPVNSDKYTLTMTVEGTEGTLGTMSAEVTRTTSGSVETTTLKISITEEGESIDVLTGTLTYDSSNGKYDVSLTAEGETIGMKGVYLVTADKFEFTVDSITEPENGEMEIKVRLGIESINKSDIPEMPNMTNILKLTQDEWVELINLIAPPQPDDFEDGYYDDDFYGDEIYDEDFYYAA